MKRIVANLVIYLQCLGYRLKLSPAAMFQLDKLCVQIAKLFYGPA